MGLINNTVRIKATFYDWNGNVAIPSDVNILLYNQSSGARIVSDSGSSIGLGSDGAYYYDFTVPPGNGNIICEFSGTLEGYPEVNRKIIAREWVRE